MSSAGGKLCTKMECKTPAVVLLVRDSRPKPYVEKSIVEVACRTRASKPQRTAAVPSLTDIDRKVMPSICLPHAMRTINHAGHGERPGSHLARERADLGVRHSSPVKFWDTPKSAIFARSSSPMRTFFLCTGNQQYGRKSKKSRQRKDATVAATWRRSGGCMKSVCMA